MNALANVEYDLRRQTEAARDLLSVLQLDGDDEELIAGSIEGETNFNEAIEAAIAEIDECDVIEAGCKAKAAEYEARGSAAARRRDRIRAGIERAMVTIDLANLRLPAATLTIAKRAPQVVVEDEAAIPARFFTPLPAPAPKLDKKALAAALADDEAIPGARLDNGSVTLTVRRK